MMSKRFSINQKGILGNMRSGCDLQPAPAWLSNMRAAVRRVKRADKKKRDKPVVTLS